MLRNRMRLCAALLCCMLLCGCDGIVLGGKNVEELLRAPRPSERQSAVQTALNAYLGETLQLKYPRGGAEPDPVIFADLDGDGAEEAAVLYTAESKGQNVHLSVLEQDGSGGWSIAYEVMGLSTEVAEVELAEVFGGSTQLVVGYANANLVDKYLEVYDYRDVTIYSACKQPYDAYLLGDLTGSGRTELAVAAATSEPGGLSLQLFVPDGRAMTAAQGVELDERLEKCTALYATRCGAARGLIVDGSVSSGAASQLLCWEDGVLFPYPDKEEGGDVFARSQRSRTLSALGPQDLSGTGEVLIPEVGASIATLQSARRFYPVEWMNYLCEQPLQQFGVYDADHNYFVRLPTEWQDNMTVSAQSESDWQIRSKEDNSLLCAVRVADRAAANGTYTQAAQLAEKKVLVYFGESCTAVQANLIRRGVAVLG